MAFFASLEGQDPAEAAEILVDRMPDGTRSCPPSSASSTPATAPSSSSTSQWFELRASGTDAVLRYYMEGRDADLVAELNEAFTR